jgi:hypothetical protein
MALPDQFADDIAETEGDVPAVMTWGGVEYPCSVGSRSGRAEMSGMVGYREGVDQIALVRRELFSSALPALRDTLTIDINAGVTYQVMRFESDEFGGLTLYLQEADA